MEKTEQLTSVLKRLNAGEDPDQVKAEAMELLATISPDELAIAEQNLLDAGLSVEDLHGLCPIHLEVLGEQLDQMRATLPKGHVVSTLVHEHDAILGFLDMLQQVNENIQQMSEYPGQTREFHQLAHIAEHLLETDGITSGRKTCCSPSWKSGACTGRPWLCARSTSSFDPESTR